MREKILVNEEKSESMVLSQPSTTSSRIHTQIHAPVLHAQLFKILCHTPVFYRLIMTKPFEHQGQLIPIFLKMKIHDVVFYVYNIRT